MPHGQKTFGPKPYRLLYKCCIRNQNRLLFKENPISNGFNLEKQQKANKSFKLVQGKHGGCCIFGALAQSRGLESLPAPLVSLLFPRMWARIS